MKRTTATTTPRITHVAAGLFEAGWLLALVLAPLFYNAHSQNIFEPDKSAVIRSLAVVLLGVLLAVALESTATLASPRSWLAALSHPLPAAAALTICAAVTSNIFSLSTRISFWGSYLRAQGVFALLCYVLLFALTAAWLRTPAQLRRLLQVVVVTSLPISLCGIVQHFGADSVLWTYKLQDRIITTLGNPIFAGAYFVMIVPLALVSASQSWQQSKLQPANRAWPLGALAIDLLAVVLALIAMLYTGSRGPALAWLGGTVLGGLALLAATGQRRYTAAIIGVGAAGAIGLLVLNLQLPMLARLRDSNTLTRYAHLLDKQDTSSSGRILIWQSAWQAINPREAITYPSGETDRLNVLRPWLGYGPEVFDLGIQAFSQPSFGRTQMPDRAHNETLDVLVTGGVLGLAAHLALLCSVLFTAMQCLNLVSNAQRRNFFWLAATAGGLLASAALWVMQGPEFIGIALPLGILAGLGIFLGWIALAKTELRATDHSHLFVVAALLAALVSHYIETAFGIATVTSRTYFWILSGALLTLKLNPNQPAAEATETHKPRKSKNAPQATFTTDSWAVPGLLCAVATCTVSNNFLINMQGLAGAGLPLLTLIVLTCLIAACRLSPDPSTALRAGALGAGISIAFIIQLLVRLSGTSSDQAVTMEKLMTIVGNRAAIFSFFCIAVLALWLAVAFALARTNESISNPSINKAAVAFGIIIAAAITAYALNVVPVQADIMARYAGKYAAPADSPTAVALYQEVLRMRPTEDQYRQLLGRAEIGNARLAKSPAVRDQHFNLAEASYAAAQLLNPLSPNHTGNLARLASERAKSSTEASAISQWAAAASKLFSSALQTSPSHVILIVDWAQNIYENQHDPALAREKFQLAITKDPTYDRAYALFGLMLFNQSAAEPARATELLLEADEQYAAALAAQRPEFRSPAFVLRANLHASLASSDPNNHAQHMRTAAQYYEDSLNARELAKTKQISDAATQEAEMGLQYEEWSLRSALAQIYFELGEKQRALPHAKAALQTAPDTERARLQQLVEALQIN